MNQLHSDTVTLLLCNIVNRHETLEVRAKSIRKLCKRMYSRNTDKKFKYALKRLYKEPLDGKVVLAIDNAERDYWSKRNELH